MNHTCEELSVTTTKSPVAISPVWLSPWSFFSLMHQTLNTTQIVFESPVYWTEKRPWTELNRTGRNRTIGCGCPNVLTSPVHGSSMVEHLSRLPKDRPQPVVDRTFSCIKLTRYKNIILYDYILN